MEIKEMCDKDLFLPRLHLLIIMSKAYLKGMPVGEHRKHAVIDNAHHLFYQSLHLLHDHPPQSSESADESGDDANQEMSSEHIFHQRVQLLSVMAKAFAEGRLTGEFKKRALKENLDYICNAITFTDKVGDMDILKVA